MDQNEICRLCAKYHPYQELTPIDDPSRCIRSKLFRCSQIDLLLDENSLLPRHACCDCVDRLEKCWNFAEVVANAQDKFQVEFAKDSLPNINEKCDRENVAVTAGNPTEIRQKQMNCGIDITQAGLFNFVDVNGATSPQNERNVTGIELFTPVSELSTKDVNVRGSQPNKVLKTNPVTQQLMKLEPNLPGGMHGKSKQHLCTKALIRYTYASINCEHCDKKFYTEYETQRHSFTAHAEKYRFGCDICDARYTLMSANLFQITAMYFY